MLFPPIIPAGISLSKQLHDSWLTADVIQRIDILPRQPVYPLLISLLPTCYTRRPGTRGPCQGWPRPWHQEKAIGAIANIHARGETRDPCYQKRAISLLCVPHSHWAYHSWTWCYLGLFTAEVPHETITISLCQTLMWSPIPLFLLQCVTGHQDVATPQGQKLCSLHCSLFPEIPCRWITLPDSKPLSNSGELITFRLFFSGRMKFFHLHFIFRVVYYGFMCMWVFRHFVAWFFKGILQWT